ncbi:MAG: hypothetical protein ACRET2_12900 [Steroidobacteraceae bacterium]
MDHSLSFATSAFPPLALGFFGLGTGYLIYGPKELFGFPKADDAAGESAINRSLGIWGIWLPGFCQFVTGVILFIGLTWFNVFTKSAPLYDAALAFSAYGIHWFAIGWNRYQGNPPQANTGMCVSYMVISALGIVVFFHASDWPVGLLFIGLFLIYLSDFFASLKVALGVRALGLFHLLTGAWLMYLMFATTVDFAIGFHWRI